MKPKKLFTKALSVLLAFSFCFFLSDFSCRGFAENSLSTEEQKAALEQRIKEANEKLSRLGDEAGETQEYLSALNEKIIYLEEEIALVEAEAEESESASENIRINYAETEAAMQKAQAEHTQLEAELEEKNAQFKENYELFCNRMRAIYISGETNILVMLLTCGGISDFLTRYEMIRRISEQDGQLLETIETEMGDIDEARRNMKEKSRELENKKLELDAAQQELAESLSALESKKSELEEKETALERQKAQANVLLKKLNDETGYYTEFLENDEETLKEIDDEIAAAAQRYLAEPATATTTTTTTTTTATTASTATTAAITSAATADAANAATAAQPSGSSASQPAGTSGETTAAEGSGEITAQTAESTAQAATSASYISLTYPVPLQTTITCAWQEYTGHSGADFSCAAGSGVVAAESGTVIISSDLTNSDGSYRSYGRYIVIMHDKTTSSGDIVYTLYAHNSQRLVTAGQHVEKGETIALSGSTGNSTGPHLHFEVRTPSSSYSDCKNPAYYLP